MKRISKPIAPEFEGWAYRKRAILNTNKYKETSVKPLVFTIHWSSW